MKRKLFSASIVAASALVSVSSAAVSLLDEYAAYYDGDADPGMVGSHKCYADCSWGTVNPMSCPNGTNCCGWYNCNTGVLNGKCCAPDTTCNVNPGGLVTCRGKAPPNP